MTDTTINPDQLAEITEIPADLRALVFSPAGPLKKVAFTRLLAKLIATSTTKTTKALLDADLAHDADKVALVFNDPTALLNGWYRKTGASGAGAWTQFEILSNGVKAGAEAAALLAKHYAMDDTDVDVPGGTAGDRGAKFWAVAAQAAGFALKPQVAGALYSEEDSEGRIVRLVQGNGAQYIPKLERPGPSGFSDRKDVWAELEALANAPLLTANTSALRAAVRSNGQLPQPPQRLVVNDTPVVTLSAAGAASTIPGSSLIAMTDARFRYPLGVPVLRSLGYPGNEFFWARGAYYGKDTDGVSELRGNNAFAVEFVHTGTQFEIKIIGGNAGAIYPSVTVLVDGKRAGDVITPSDGTIRLIKCVFPVTGTRTIRILMHGALFGGARVAGPDVIGSTGKTYPIMTIMGDSFVEGAGVTTPCGSLAAVMATALGLCGGIAGVGSTGLINTGGNNTAGRPKTSYTDPTRLLDLTLAGTGFAPALGVVFGTGNDVVSSGLWGPFGTSLEQAICNRMHVVIDAWSAASESAGKPLFVFPNWNVHGQIAGPMALENYYVRDGMQQACEARRSENVWFFDQLVPDLMLGLASTAGTQSDYYSHTDDVHPSQAGHNYRGMRFADQVRQTIFSLA